ncbi:unnamed protein product [Ectocarpus fasciculatus]
MKLFVCHTALTAFDVLPIQLKRAHTHLDRSKARVFPLLSTLPLLLTPVMWTGMQNKYKHQTRPNHDNDPYPRATHSISNSQVQCRGNEEEQCNQLFHDTHKYYLQRQVFVSRENASPNYKRSCNTLNTSVARRLNQVKCEAVEKSHPANTWRHGGLTVPLTTPAWQESHATHKKKLRQGGTFLLQVILASTAFYKCMVCGQRYDVDRWQRTTLDDTGGSILLSSSAWMRAAQRPAGVKGG